MNKRFQESNCQEELLSHIANKITEIVIQVLNEEKAIFRKSKVQEYRDTILGEHHKLKFTNFCNEDIYRYEKYNG